MAEADAFIFTALQQSNCLIVDNEKAGKDQDQDQDHEQHPPWTVKTLDGDALVAIVWRCLGRIQEYAKEDTVEFTIPTNLDAPKGVAARHREGSQLANILKELGYAGDCGYNHFLYPSEKETRQILSWLVGKLPQSRQETSPGEDYAAEVGGVTGTATHHGSSSLAVVVSKERLETIFSTWKRERTLHILPKRELPELRGYQALPLKTAPVELPWQCVNSSSDGRFLFDEFPSGAIKSISLLAALSSGRQTGSSFTDVLEDFEENDVPLRRTTSRQKDKLDTATTLDGLPSTEDFLIPHASEIEEDRFTAAGTEDDTLSNVPNLPLAFDIGAISAEHLDLSHVHLDEVNGQGRYTKERTMDAGADQAEHTDSSHGTLHHTLVDDVDGEEIQAGADEEQQLQQIHAQLEATQQRIGKMRKIIEKEQKELEQIRQSVNKTAESGRELKRQLATRKQMLSMLPHAEENITKLESICQKSAAKLDELAAEWEAHCTPLVQEEARLLAMKSNRKLRCREFVDEMKTFRREMKEMAVTIQQKMEQLRVLEKTYARLSQDINRNMYTNRIMDIIKQVHKQKQEITKIIEDIKVIQKQLNFASEKLKRSEAVAEDKLYNAAASAVNGNSSSSSSGKDGQNAYVECYRKFAQVRELFEELILVVGDVGKKENAARDLENWILQLQSRDSSRHLDKVLADLQSVKQENSMLTAQLRAWKA